MNHEPDPNAAASELSADVGAERLARVYARSLLAAADEVGQTQAVIEEVDSLLDDIFRQQPHLEVLFSSAAIGRKARRDAIEKAFRGRASDVFVKFLLVLNDHERLELLRPVRQALHDLDNERNRRVKVHVFSAIALPAEFGDRIAEAVRHRFGLEPILNTHVDPSILGGLKVRIGDRQLDATVRTRLDNLRNEIIARSSHEIQSRRNRFCID
jgi:F-type H+-transporting ATPase subunit delta